MVIYQDMYMYSYMSILSLIIPLINICITVLVMVWMYKDAKSRNIEPAGWLILTFCISWFCIGIIYLIYRDGHPVVEQDGIYGTGGPQLNSVQYGSPQPQYRKQQPQCGQPQPQYGQPQSRSTTRPQPTQQQSRKQKTKFCKFCGGEMPNDAKFCSICGASEFSL